MIYQKMKHTEPSPTQLDQGLGGAVDEQSKAMLLGEKIDPFPGLGNLKNLAKLTSTRSGTKSFDEY